MKKWLKNINPNVIWLSLASFVNDLSSEMIIPILPMFLKSLGAGSIVIGIVGGMRDGLANILKVFGGYFSDKLGKKKIFIISGYLISNVFKVCLSFSSSWLSALIFSTSERLGKGIRTAPSDKMISEYMPMQKGKAFGIHRAFDTAGAIAGSILALLLFWFLDFNFKTIIFIAAVIAFIAFIPLKFVEEVKVDPCLSSSRRRGSIKLFSFSKGFKFFILISSIFAFANFSYMFFLLKAQGFFVESFACSEKYSFVITMLFYVLYNIFYSFLAIPLGLLSDKVGRKRILIVGYLLFFMTSVGFVFAHSVFMFILLFAGYGFFCAIVNSNQRAFVSDLAQEKSLGFSLGFFHTTIGIMTLFGSIVAGILWQVFSPCAPFVLSAIVSFVATLLLIFLKV